MFAPTASPLPINDRGQSARLDAKMRRELGETVLRALADERTEDLVLNPDSRLWVKRQGEGFQCIGEMPPAQAQTAMGTIAAQKGTVINHDRPILETELPIDGSRFEGLMPPVVSRPIFAIRQRPRRIFTLDDYEQAGILSDSQDPLNRRRWRSGFADLVRGLSHAEVIRAAIAEKKNILIVGSTESGRRRWRSWLRRIVSSRLRTRSNSNAQLRTTWTCGRLAT